MPREISQKNPEDRCRVNEAHHTSTAIWCGTILRCNAWGPYGSCDSYIRERKPKAKTTKTCVEHCYNGKVCGSIPCEC